MALFHHTIAGTTPGETWSFNIHTVGSGDLASAQAGAMGAADVLFRDHLAALMAPDVSLTSVATASLNEATDKQISREEDGLVIAGTATAEMLPPQVALGVSWKSDFATRSGQGRIYLPPLAVSTVDAGRASAATVTAVVAGINAFWASLQTVGLALVIRGKTSHTSVSVTRGSVGNVYDTQRRRRNKLIEIRTPLTAP